MDCEFGYTNCKNAGKRCDLCFDASNYVAIKAKSNGLRKRNNEKPTGRMGELFERNNHKAVKNNIESVTTGMTPNRGAGKVKGDQQITGLIRIMEELKTQDPNRARGHNQFTIQRKWLDKLDREAPAENMEFWYLKFAFCDTDDQSYIVFDSGQMNDMIATIIHDRKKANEADAKVKVANTRRVLAEAEATKLFAEVEYLKALLDKEGIEYDVSITEQASRRNREDNTTV